MADGEVMTTAMDQPPQYISSLPPAQQPQAVPYPAGLSQQKQSPGNAAVVVQQPAAGYTTSVDTTVCPNHYLGRSLFACLCCFWPLGIYALANSFQVKSRFSDGDYAGAHGSSSRAKEWSRISIIVGSILYTIFGIIIVFYLILYGIGALAASDS